MGSYVYKVTGKTRILSNGETANVAVFAYKPVDACWDRNADAVNKRMARESGVPYHEVQADKGKRSQWVVHGETGNCVLKFPFPVGSYNDDVAVQKYHVPSVTVGEETHPMPEKTFEKIVPEKIFELVENYPDAIFKVPVDPKMHQKPGELYAPVTKQTLLSIIAHVHRSARYTVRIWKPENPDSATPTIIHIKKPK